MTNYLVTGVTGNLGRRIAAHLRLLSPDDSVLGLVRRGARTVDLKALGVSPVHGDYDDPKTIGAALAQADRLVLVSSPILDPLIRARQHLTVISAAQKADLERIVYTSALGAERDAGHLETEQALDGGTTPHTILRNGLYSEPFVRLALAEASAHGYVSSSTGGRPLRTASIDDLAEAASLTALAADPDGSLRSLNGNPWTYEQLAVHLSRRLGRPVRERHVSDADLGPVGQVHALFRNGLMAQQPNELAAILGRPPRSVEAVADTLAADPN